ncbi:MAG: hypothetical protein P1V20_30315 [Verrucomicrobiales bacterium]|nr:hypothetical protein [Verrucomicrobiales bacterium]
MIFKSIKGKVDETNDNLLRARITEESGAGKSHAGICEGVPGNWRTYRNRLKNMRVPCTKCGTEILEATAKANDGLCGPCSRGAGFCVVCGKRVWVANKTGEYIHINCSLKIRDEEVAAASGISWSRPNEIDWDALGDGILAATQRCFTRVADANQNRIIKDVVVAYRIGEGVGVEPCVTFSDGEYLNASLDDDSLFNDLEPFDSAIIRIEEDLDDEQREQFIELLESRVPPLMEWVFEALKRSNFGLDLAEGCNKTLKVF